MTDEKNTGIFVQNTCLQHKYIRTKDLSTIVERPERLRAVNIGLSAAVARLEELFLTEKNSIARSHPSKDETNPNDLVDDMNRLSLGQSLPQQRGAPSPVTITYSQATVDLSNHSAVKFIHGDIERDVYLENLKKWASQSVDKIKNGQSEIPDNYSQGDLYLCPGSINAIQGAIGTVCEAVDKVILSTQSTDHNQTLHRAFVPIRPPGHHCGEDTPSGFCFVNNVAIGAAHAHLNHGIKRAVILDIDLHHGNGTQSIVWQINEETYRQTLESEESNLDAKNGLKIFYGSIHDVLSYPCEDGKLELVQAASTSIHKNHGQYIENVHLETYNSEEHFWEVLYPQKYKRILHKAREFLDHTGGPGADVMVFVSCGMDACEHEYESMSRHNRKVPTSFYYQFARDTCRLSDEYAKGRVISVLEGGYSDRALISGAMAHLAGLVDLPPSLKVDEDWWSVENLVKLESATKKRRGGRPSLPSQASAERWLERTFDIFASFEAAASQATASVPRITVPVPASSRTLRDKSKTKDKTTTPTSLPPSNSADGVKPSKPLSRAKFSPPKQAAYLDGAASPISGPTPSPHDTETETLPERKLPKVILKLGKPVGP